MTVGGREIHLTPTEYELLKAFIAHPNKVLTDRMLLQRVWGVEYGSEDHYLHVYVARLRKKLFQPSNSTSTGRSSITRRSTCHCGGAASSARRNQKKP